MNRKTTRRSAVLAAAAVVTATAVLGLAPAALADTSVASFTAGDLVVLRGGDATNSDAAGGNAVSGEVSAYLDEYTAAGTYVGTVNVGSGLTLPGYGVISHEGVLSRSVNGQYLSFAGYATPAGTAPRPSDGTATDVLGLIGTTAASLNTSTTITPAEGTGQYIRGAVTANGTSFYAFGKYPAGSTPGSGIQSVNGTGPTAAVTTVEGTTDWRDLFLGNNTLYGGTGSSSVGAHGAYQIGTAGSPPTAAVTASANTLLTNYSGGQSASSLALLDVTTADAAAKTQNGYDVLYTIGDQTTPSITKYYYNGTAWQPAGTFVTFNATNSSYPVGLAAEVDPANSGDVDLYVSGQNGIYSYVDTSGDPAASLPNNAFNLIATPSANEAFYGLAFAPTATSAVPEPATAALATVAAAATLAGRRRRRRQA